MIFKSINKINSLIAILIIAAGFALLSSHIYPSITMYSLFFAGILAILVLKINFKDLFKPIKLKDIGIIILGIFASMVLATISATLLKVFHVQTAGNPAIAEFGTTLNTIIPRLLKTVPQLLGEEFLTLIPFLILMKYFDFKGIATKKASLIALIVTSIAFGLLHLPTYNWNLLQCLIVISLARIPFTLSYIKTKNIFIPWITHVLFDWTNFILAIIALTKK